MKKLILATIVSLGLFSPLQASTVKELIIEGNTLWSQGKLTEAETQFKKAIEINPESSQAHARLANLYLTQNKTLKAVEEFQNAITNDSEDAHLFIGLSIAYLHQKRYAMAEAVAKQAIELNPELANAKKLMQYIDAKNEKLSMAPAPQDAMHGSAPSTSMKAHDTMASPHGNTNHSTPAAVKKSMEK